MWKREKRARRINCDAFVPFSFATDLMDSLTDEGMRTLMGIDLPPLDLPSLVVLYFPTAKSKSMFFLLLSQRAVEGVGEGLEGGVNAIFQPNPNHHRPLFVVVVSVISIT